MRVCIVTPFDAANYGAFLQAYASKKYLEAQGCEVKFLAWRSEKERKTEFFNKPKTIKALLRYYQKYPFLKTRFKLFTDALKVFDVIDNGHLNNVDVVIVGSDEVWNIKEAKFQKECFYGGNMSSKVTRLAYAPSVANACIDDFGEYDSLAHGLKDIYLIGARDEETKNVFFHYTGVETSIVCDPTLLLNNEEWNLPVVENRYGRYILVYSYDIPKDHRTMLAEVARRRKCKLIAVGLYQSWCDINLCCDPLEFNALINNSEAVYTTTFHGSIFTLKNHKRCLIRAKSKKLIDLLVRYNAESFMEPDDIDANTMEKLLFQDRNYNVVDEQINAIREQSRLLYSGKLNEIKKGLYN